MCGVFTATEGVQLPAAVEPQHWRDGATRVVTVENLTTGDEVFRLEDTPEAALMALSPDGGMLVFGGESNANARELLVFDLTTREQVTTLAGHAGSTLAAEFVDGARRLVTTGGDGLINV